MEVLRAGREPNKIEIECPHCTARYKMDQRQALIRFLNVCNRQAIVLTQCKHCINPIILSLRKQAELGVTEDMLFVAWLMQIASLSERGKREFEINDQGGFIARVGATPAPTVPLQGATPPQSPQQCEPESPGSFEVPE